MSLADDLQAVGPTGPGPLCTVGRLLDGLNDEDRATLLGWLQDKNLTTATITLALRSRIAPKIGDYTIQRHRRKLCRCR